MTTEEYRVPGPWPGRLAIVPRPRGGDWLADEMRRWREADIDVVVSLLTPEESSELGLREEGEHARAAGLEFHGFPITDRGVPGSRAATVELIEVLGRELAAGRRVALHCRQGIGRSALVAASLLVAAGEEPATALRTIERVRGVPVPETAAQRQWVEELALEDRRATAAPAIR